MISYYVYIYVEGKNKPGYEYRCDTEKEAQYLISLLDPVVDWKMYTG